MTESQQRLLNLTEAIDHARKEADDLEQPFLAYLLEMAKLEVLRSLETQLDLGSIDKFDCNQVRH